MPGTGLRTQQGEMIILNVPESYFTELSVLKCSIRSKTQLRILQNSGVLPRWGSKLSHVTGIILLP